MTDVVLAAILGVLGGIVLSVLLLLARRLARGAADLGSDAEQAALTALHQASLAAPHLRAGLSDSDVVKAARHLRVLLGSAAVAIVSAEGTVSFDGPSDGLESAARRIAAQVGASGRRQVFPAPGREDDLEAVGAPILVDGRVAGVVVAFAAPVRAALVRAAEEVADWCAAQVELGGLDAQRTQLAEAELRSLRAQISPHFIYNALTAIASFILTDPARARELVLEFADFTRYSFRRQGEFTTIAEELGSIHSYLELERARFGDRLRVTLQIAPETLATVIPFLSVQPLVENAVRHGLEPGEGGGEIRIASRDDGTHTEITVEDDGVGMDPEALRATLTAGDDGVHVGLRNVDTRLRQLYGADGGLVVETNTGAGTLVRMRVPKSQPQHDPDND
ncbi:sensor histidine kinase [Microbacterium sp.]|uniref:sensor histidine kinase n=1 Tax=Microbacterium sp. TaxID=51671 RepID=UPI0026119EFD|nr:histidine kinase [Microbacterium sp.]MCV0334335.1 histidine kinase [Microbacterium sp.]MCV0376161.1 histidine kinase [Microbacterium sp.]MCV0390039.1 histidine kinase [Microbacterium sp.]MCV0420248.1 histidine kinase [Microbacterium sp.]MCV0422558.1 histidine kinase [Microbacterium sp.]